MMNFFTPNFYTILAAAETRMLCSATAGEFPESANPDFQNHDKSVQ